MSRGAPNSPSSSRAGSRQNQVAYFNNQASEVEDSYSTRGRYIRHQAFGDLDHLRQIEKHCSDFDERMDSSTPGSPRRTGASAAAAEEPRRSTFFLEDLENYYVAINAEIERIEGLKQQLESRSFLSAGTIKLLNDWLNPLIQKRHEIAREGYKQSQLLWGSDSVNKTAGVEDGASSASDAPCQAKDYQNWCQRLGTFGSDSDRAAVQKHNKNLKVLADITKSDSELSKFLRENLQSLERELANSGIRLAEDQNLSEVQLKGLDDELLMRLLEVANNIRLHIQKVPEANFTELQNSLTDEEQKRAVAWFADIKIHFNRRYLKALWEELIARTNRLSNEFSAELVIRQINLLSRVVASSVINNRVYLVKSTALVHSKDKSQYIINQKRIIGAAAKVPSYLGNSGFFRRLYDYFTLGKQVRSEAFGLSDASVNATFSIALYKIHFEAYQDRARIARQHANDYQVTKQLYEGQVKQLDVFYATVNAEITRLQSLREKLATRGSLSGETIKLLEKRIASLSEERGKIEEAAYSRMDEIYAAYSRKPDSDELNDLLQKIEHWNQRFQTVNSEYTRRSVGKLAVLKFLQGISSVNESTFFGELDQYFRDFSEKLMQHGLKRSLADKENLPVEFLHQLTDEALKQLTEMAYAVHQQLSSAPANDELGVFYENASVDSRLKVGLADFSNIRQRFDKRYLASLCQELVRRTNDPEYFTSQGLAIQLKALSPVLAEGRIKERVNLVKAELLLRQGDEYQLDYKKLTGMSKIPNKPRPWRFFRGVYDYFTLGSQVRYAVFGSVEDLLKLELYRVQPLRLRGSAVQYGTQLNAAYLAMDKEIVRIQKLRQQLVSRASLSGETLKLLEQRLTSLIDDRNVIADNSKVLIDMLCESYCRDQNSIELNALVEEVQRWSFRLRDLKSVHTAAAMKKLKTLQFLQFLNDPDPGDSTPYPTTFLELKEWLQQLGGGLENAPLLNKIVLQIKQTYPVLFSFILRCSMETCSGDEQMAFYLELLSASDELAESKKSCMAACLLDRLTQQHYQGMLAASMHALCPQETVRKLPVLQQGLDYHMRQSYISLSNPGQLHSFNQVIEYYANDALKASWAYRLDHLFEQAFRAGLNTTHPPEDVALPDCGLPAGEATCKEIKRLLDRFVDEHWTLEEHQFVEKMLSGNAASTRDCLHHYRQRLSLFLGKGHEGIEASLGALLRNRPAAATGTEQVAAMRRLSVVSNAHSSVESGQQSLPRRASCPNLKAI